MQEVKKLLLLFLLLLIGYNKSFSQKIISNNPSAWLGYFSQSKLNSKFSIISDFQIRHIQENFGIDLKEGRAGLMFMLKKNIGIINGIAFFNQQKLDNNLTKIKINEFRFWQEIKLNSQVNNNFLTNRFRIEERFFSNSSFPFFRLRHKIEYDICISKKIKLLTANELMWQFNKETNAWDQNRTSIGIERKLVHSFGLQLILISWWQFSSNTIQPTVRINLMHRFN